MTTNNGVRMLTVHVLALLLPWHGLHCNEDEEGANVDESTGCLAVSTVIAKTNAPPTTEMAETGKGSTGRPRSR